eukprot:TRINITY_DN22638_c0_g1_i1.p1 TRINITY_DN22638_c0_g1~~TRINITY_DN22638_c0_g1_i1.p1  ORF type:complete len:542 (+),score=83.48 TRINITY_DN22638_c0_g1_i1:39-1664(+)
MELTESKNVCHIFIQKATGFAIEPEPMTGPSRISATLRQSLKQRQDVRREIEEAKKDTAPDNSLGLFLALPGDETAPSSSSGGPQRNLLPPWARSQYEALAEFPMHVRLHEEIVDWMLYISPTSAERKLRNLVVNRVVRVAKELFPECRVHVFGSIRTGLLLPSSDVDIAILGVTENTAQALERIRTRLELNNICHEPPKIIHSAKVPIVKFTDRTSRLDCDISLNAGNGCRNTAILRKYLADYPAAVPLILLVKSFLKSRRLNEVFLGGLGSYSVSLMVISFLQMFYTNPSTPEAFRGISLGKLLIDFLDLYGRHFEYNRCAISVRDGGSYIPKEVFKRTDPLYNPNRPPLNFRLALEDPQCPTNDVSGGSRDMPNIRSAFAQAYAALTFAQPPPLLRAGNVFAEHPDPTRRPTLLSRILKIDRDMIIKRDMLQGFYEDLQNSAAPAAEEDLLDYESDTEDTDTMPEISEAPVFHAASPTAPYNPAAVPPPTQFGHERSGGSTYAARSAYLAQHSAYNQTHPGQNAEHPAKRQRGTLSCL